MRSIGFLLLAAGASAQSISYVYTATFTDTVIEYATLTTCPCTTTTSMTTFQTTSTTISTNTGPVLPSDTGTDIAVPTAPITTPAMSAAASGSGSAASATTSSGLAVVTDAAYISTVLLHHNIHRSNHTANPLVWSDDMAGLARQIAETCVYKHVTGLNGESYGQNIGAGYPGTPLGMGEFITEGLYNGEVNNYIYYGQEPNITTLDLWGHFSQIVWKGSSSVGCYTADCSATGLQNAGPPIQPYFSVCNYAPAGNIIGYFTPNIGASIGLPTVYGYYQSS